MVFFIFSEIFFVNIVSAQKENVLLHPDKFYKKFFPNLRIKNKKPFDSLYIKTYPNYLSVGTHFLLPKIYLDINSPHSNGAGGSVSSNFRTNVSDIIGFSASYRFVTAGFALALNSNIAKNEGYAHTSYHTATIKYNGPKYSLQFRYMKIVGLTDINESNNQDTSHRYINREDISIKEFQFEGIYNFGWKKYSYTAPIDYFQRQLKSRVGILLKAGVYYNQVQGDSNLLSGSQRAYFDNFDNVLEIVNYNVKVAPGVGGNLVFLRKFYLSAAVFTPYNLCFNKLYTYDEKLISNATSILITLDGVVSLGYQSKRLYAGIKYQADSKRANFGNYSVNTLYSYFGMDVGYRFIAPKILKKIYKKTMPPGM